MDITSSQLFDRILGCFAGLAAGDALGQTYRGLTWQQVAELFERVESFQKWSDSDGHRHPAGEVSETLRLAADAALLGLSHENVPASGDILTAAEKMGNISSLALRLAVERSHARPVTPVRGLPEVPGAEPLYLGAVLGALSPGDPEAAFLRTGAACGFLAEGPSLEAGQTLAAAVASAFFPESEPSTVLDTALEYAPPAVSRVLQRAALFAREHLAHPLSLITPAIDSHLTASPGVRNSPLEALAVGLVCVYASDGRPQAAITAAAAYGGLSHATAAASGALTGALRGASALPAQWTQALKQSNPNLQLEKIASAVCKLVLNQVDEATRRTQMLNAMTSAPVSPD
ncbi:MAG: ADP-ribosylglycohydrolase family protein [Armatimonadetes bacterium]|nr:ADP-ribosylglycohydrolase family protein [Armatimonadota bacterium]